MNIFDKVTFNQQLKVTKRAMKNSGLNPVNGDPFDVPLSSNWVYTDAKNN